MYSAQPCWLSHSSPGPLCHCRHANSSPSLWINTVGIFEHLLHTQTTHIYVCATFLFWSMSLWISLLDTGTKKSFQSLLPRFSALLGTKSLRWGAVSRSQQPYIDARFPFWALKLEIADFTETDLQNSWAQDDLIPPTVTAEKNKF